MSGSGGDVPIDYVSTRGGAPHLAFDDVLLEGLAVDGGLYVPDRWPRLAASSGRGHALPAADERHAAYCATAVDVMWPFVAGSFSRPELERLVVESYAAFDPPADRDDGVVPLVEVSGGRIVAELFWGPTFAFKDIALQLVGRMFDHVLAARGERMTIVGATSGDTGSAAIDACRDRSAMDIVILHPDGRTSEVQRRQMTTVDAPNVHNVAIDGTFDDCQRIVKALFADDDFRRRQNLSAVNSINWARVMAQIVYYVWAVDRLGGSPVDVVVPTGNFGNVFAGFAATRMGTPIDRLVVASNTNDILPRFFESAVMEVTGVTPTLSPSMDIQISSNFERLLFELVGRDGATVDAMVGGLADEGRLELDSDRFAPLSERWSSARVDDDSTIAEIAATYAECGYVADPHTAVGLAAARHHSSERPVVVMGTAHPAKFPDAVERAIGERPVPPARLAAVMTADEHYVRLPADVDAVRRFVDSVTPLS